MFGQIYGTGTGITGQIEDAPEVVATEEERSFWTEVDKFKAKADEAFTLWQKLRAKRQAAASNPELMAEYSEVMEGAEDMQAKVSDVERAVAAARSGVAETITSWFGLEGINVARNVARNANLGELGIAQFAILAVAAAIAWIGTWLSKAYIVDRKLTAVETLNAQGVPISEAGKIIAEKGDPGPMGALFGNLGTGLAVAGVVGVVLYFFFEKKRGF